MDLLVDFVTRKNKSPIFEAELLLHRDGNSNKIANGMAYFFYSSGYNKNLVEFHGSFSEGYSLQNLAEISSNNETIIEGVGVNDFRTKCFITLHESEIYRLLDHKSESSQYTSIKFEPHFVILENEHELRSSNENKIVGYLDGIEPSNWSGDVFKYWSSMNDNDRSIDFKFQNTNISIEPIENSYTVVEISEFDDKSYGFKLLTALVNAMSYLLGDNFNSIATYAQFESKEFATLHPVYLNRPRRDTRLRPVPTVDLSNPVKPFLEKSMGLFMKENSGALRQLHGFLIDTHQLDLSSREMACGIAVEGMFNFVLELYKDHSLVEQYSNNKAAYKSFIKPIRKFIKDIPKNDPESELFKKKALNDLRGEFDTARDRLNTAATILGLNFSTQEINRWNSMRNTAAHADLFNKKEDSERWIDLRFSTYIFFAFYLGLINWKGPYYDLRQSVSKVIYKEE